MNQALIALLEKKDIAFISVTEITQKAGVNRSTFYLHYENIYDLLEETIENLNKKFINAKYTYWLHHVLTKENNINIHAKYNQQSK
jgi:AcrR family transcriptional regulator